MSSILYVDWTTLQTALKAGSADLLFHVADQVHISSYIEQNEIYVATADPEVIAAYEQFKASHSNSFVIENIDDVFDRTIGRSCVRIGMPEQPAPATKGKRKLATG